MGFLAGLVLLLPTPTLAHPITRGVGTQTFIYLFEDRIELRVNLGFAPGPGLEALFVMDSDGNGKVSPAEKMAFLKQTAPELAQALDVRVNGRKVSLALVRLSGSGIIGDVDAPTPFDTWFRYRAALPPSHPETGGWWLHYHDASYPERSSSQLLWMPLRSHGQDMSFVVFSPDPQEWDQEGDYLRHSGRKGVIFFDTRPRPEMRPDRRAAPTLDELSRLVDDAAGASASPPEGRSPAGAEGTRSSPPPPPTDEDRSQVSRTRPPMEASGSTTRTFVSIVATTMVALSVVVTVAVWILSRRRRKHEWERLE